MGTKGFVVFTADNVISFDTLILGVTSDGFLNNLVTLAQEAMEEAKKARVLTKFRKGDRETVKLVLQRVCQNTQGWAFVDTFKNAMWIDYSVIVNTKIGKMTMWEGKLEYAYTAPGSVLQATAKVAV